MKKCGQKYNFLRYLLLATFAILLIFIIVCWLLFFNRHAVDTSHNRPLRILLTNDDGYDGAGINAMFEALNDHPCEFDVTMVAPADGQSGASASISQGQDLFVTKLSERKYHVNGFPADCVRIGIKRVLETVPDLVISGINKGQNVGADVIISGTVGAARAATAEFGIPAIATSLRYTSKKRRYEDAAQSVINLIREYLNTETMTMDLPHGTCLNNNYPSVKESSVQNVVYVPLSTMSGLITLYNEDDKNPGAYSIDFGGLVDFSTDLEDTDGKMLADNYITVTPLKTNWTAYNVINSLSPKLDNNSFDDFLNVSPLSITAPINVLLVNDEGLNADGISALLNVFNAFPTEFNVVTITPEEAQIGAAARFTSPAHGSIVVNQQGVNVYEVNAYPSDAVRIAMTTLLGTDCPDLVISGIHSGSVIGYDVHYSANVGNALTTLVLFDLPAIAVNLDDDQGNSIYYSDAANFVITLIRRLTDTSGNIGFPDGVFLNVNYPDLPFDRIAGVKVVAQGTPASHDYTYEGTSDEEGAGLFTLKNLGRNHFDNEDQDTDGAALGHGYVTIAPLQGLWTDTTELNILKRGQ